MLRSHLNDVNDPKHLGSSGETYREGQLFLLDWKVLSYSLLFCKYLRGWAEHLGAGRRWCGTERSRKRSFSKALNTLV